MAFSFQGPGFNSEIVRPSAGALRSSVRTARTNHSGGLKPTISWEGIIAKDGDSLYISARSRDWLKFKCLNEQELVIGGYTDPKGDRVGFGALLVGYYESGKLVYAGKVGTGYDTATLRRLGGQLEKLEISHCPFTADALPSGEVHWVKPKLVAQIAFGEWTSAGKLRQPRFLGLCSDKDPQEVIRERKHA